MTQEVFETDMIDTVNDSSISEINYFFPLMIQEKKHSILSRFTIQQSSFTSLNYTE